MFRRRERERDPKDGGVVVAGGRVGGDVRVEVVRLVAGRLREHSERRRPNKIQKN